MPAEPLVRRSGVAYQSGAVVRPGLVRTRGRPAISQSAGKRVRDGAPWKRLPGVGPAVESATGVFCAGAAHRAAPTVHAGFSGRGAVDISLTGGPVSGCGQGIKARYTRQLSMDSRRLRQVWFFLHVCILSVVLKDATYCPRRLVANPSMRLSIPKTVQNIFGAIMSLSSVSILNID